MFSVQKTRKFFDFSARSFPLHLFVLIFNNLRYFLTVNPLSEIPPMPSFVLPY